MTVVLKHGYAPIEQYSGKGEQEESIKIFPKMTFYASITDENGNTVDSLDKTDFDITEINSDGNVATVGIDKVYRVVDSGRISMNLVLDASGSMDYSNKMQQAKNAANGFVGRMDREGGDSVEIISFDDYVYLNQEFTNDEALLNAAINGINTGGSTALYDALYAGLFQTYYERGAKCVIGFTDGAENASSYSFDDVIDMAKNTGIPVYIIGIGAGYDTSELENMALQCGGKYYSADESELETILGDIYYTLYTEQQDYYVFEYTSNDLNNTQDYRELSVQTSETSEFYGSYKKGFVPQADISGAFSAEYMNRDFIIETSQTVPVTVADLNGLSLAELRIARNEIFARHGRQFKDPFLNQWFYSKVWYLNLGRKYSPDDFGRIKPYPLSKLEIDNVNVILEYENEIMNTRDIYPNASMAVLSEYDLALAKNVLKKALEQLNRYPSSDILNENKRLIQENIDKEEVTY